MNHFEEYYENDNLPPGFVDEGTRHKSGTRNNINKGRLWSHSNKDWPRTIQEADAQMNIIRQNPKAYDFENTRGNNKGA